MSKFPAPIEAANKLGPSLPPINLLTPSAPREAWERAIRQAARSTFHRYRTGATLFDPRSGRILSSDCSKPIAVSLHAVSSMHAESGAVARAKHVDLVGAEAVIVCVSAKSGGWAWSACPCRSCASQMQQAGLQMVHFPQRDNFGAWHVVSCSPSSLMARATKPQGKEARQQRIWMPVSA
jgi:deoxycytidylate deaminase